MKLIILDVVRYLNTYHLADEMIKCKAVVVVNVFFLLVVCGF